MRAARNRMSVPDRAAPRKRTQSLTSRVSAARTQCSQTPLVRVRTRAQQPDETHKQIFTRHNARFKESTRRVRVQIGGTSPLPTPKTNAHNTPANGARPQLAHERRPARPTNKAPYPLL